MAVTKIRKISSWTLWTVAGISIAVLALFFLGGEIPDQKDKTPIYTAELLYWGYTVLALAVVALIGFGAFQFTTSLMTNPKKALASLSVIVVFLVLLGITYGMGDATALPGINTESAVYNIPFWLKVTDMWLYTAYVLGTLCVLAVLSGSVIKIIKK